MSAAPQRGGACDVHTRAAPEIGGDVPTEVSALRQQLADALAEKREVEAQLRRSKPSSGTDEPSASPEEQSFASVCRKLRRGPAGDSAMPATSTSASARPSEERIVGDKHAEHASAALRPQSADVGHTLAPHSRLGVCPGHWVASVRQVDQWTADDVRGFFSTLPFSWIGPLLHDDSVDGKRLLGWDDVEMIGRFKLNRLQVLHPPAPALPRLLHEGAKHAHARGLNKHAMRACCSRMLGVDRRRCFCMLVRVARALVCTRVLAAHSSSCSARVCATSDWSAQTRRAGARAAPASECAPQGRRASKSRRAARAAGRQRN